MFGERSSHTQTTLEKGVVDAQEVIKDLNARLTAAEATITQQQQTINYLQTKLDAQIKESASVSSVNALRQEFQLLQSSMMEHSGKVLDVLAANLGTKK